MLYHSFAGKPISLLIAVIAFLKANTMPIDIFNGGSPVAIEKKS